MVKLKYKQLDFNGLTIHYAKYRRNRNLRLSINRNGIIKLTCPYYASNNDIYDFLKDKESWIRDNLKKMDETTNLSELSPLEKIDKKYLLNRINIYITKY